MPKNIYEIIEERRSVRSYRSDSIPEEKIKRILEAARMAPSAHNAQNYKFIVVLDKNKIKEISHYSSGQKFISEAPVVIVAVSLNPEDVMESEVPTYALDIAIALDHITLAAVEENLGTCWIGAFSQEEIKKILNIPQQYKIGAMLTLGRPYDAPQVKSRKRIDELVCYDNFSEIE